MTSKKLQNNIDFRRTENLLFSIKKVDFSEPIRNKQNFPNLELTFSMIKVSTKNFMAPNNHEIFHSTFSEKNINEFLVGMYSYHLKRFLDRFSRKQFLVIDGDELRTNPSKVMDKVQGFMDLPRCITKENFIFNETKGFYCIKDSTNNEQCLDDNKGTSRYVTS
jgi:hypothetical protein